MHSRLQSGRLAEKLREHTALAAIAQWSRREERDKQLYWQVAGCAMSTQDENTTIGAGGACGRRPVAVPWESPVVLPYATSSRQFRKFAFADDCHIGLRSRPPRNSLRGATTVRNFLAAFEPHAQHFLIVFRFGLHRDFRAAGRVDATAVASARIAFVLAWAHFRMLGTDLPDLGREPDCSLLTNAAGVHNADVERVRWHLYRGLCRGRERAARYSRRYGKRREVRQRPAFDCGGIDMAGPNWLS